MLLKMSTYQLFNKCTVAIFIRSRTTAKISAEVIGNNERLQRLDKSLRQTLPSTTSRTDCSNVYLQAVVDILQMYQIQR